MSRLLDFASAIRDSVLESVWSELDRGGALVRARPMQYGRWITLGAKDGNGGSPVYIENGRITKGAPSLTGRKIDALKDEPESGTHRQELYRSKGHARATWAKQAREAGVNPEHLHQLAGELLAHDKAFADEKAEILKDARRRLAEHGGEAKSIHLTQDKDWIKGVDEVAEDLTTAYGRTITSDDLMAMLHAGNPEPMSEADAYATALDQLTQAEPEESVPFSRRARSSAPREDYPVLYQFVEEDHPRDRAGKFMGTQSLSAAAFDADAEASVRKSLHADDSAKLDSALAKIRAEHRQLSAFAEKPASLKKRAGAIGDIFNREHERFRHLSDSQRAELATTLLHQGILSRLTHEAGSAEFDAHGSYNGTKVWLDSKHRGGASGKAAIATKDVKKKLRQIKRYRAEGKGVFLNMVFHESASNSATRGLYYVPGFGAKTETQYGPESQAATGSHLRPVRLLDGPEMDRLLAGDHKMAKEVEKRATQYLDQADVQAIEDALKGQGSDVLKSVAKDALSQMTAEERAELMATFS